MHAARLRKGGLEALWGNYMRARRSKDQIIVEILNICEKGENLTNIVDCTPDNGQIVKQWYLRQPPLRTEPEICN